MSRAKETNLVKDSPVARLVTEMVNNSDKTQYQIAIDSGFDGHTNIITMLKTGRTKFPLNRVMSFSLATDTDPEILLDACLKEYFPEVADILSRLKGRVLSKPERQILTALRAFKRDQDQAYGRHQWTQDEEAIEKWVKSSKKILIKS